MEKKEFYKNKLVEKVKTLPKETLLEFYLKEIDNLSLSQIEESLLYFNFDLNEFFTFEKEEIIKNLFSIDKIDLKGSVSNAEPWGDPDYSWELDSQSNKILSQATHLAFVSYNEGQKQIAYDIVNKLYDIEISVEFFDDYCDDSIDYESYGFSDVSSDLDVKSEDIFLIKKIRKESAIYGNNIDTIIDLLSTSYIDDYEGFIDDIKRINPQLLYRAGDAICDRPSLWRFMSNMDYIYSVIDDYKLYKKAVITIHGPSIFISFLNKYHYLSQTKGLIKDDLFKTIEQYLEEIYKNKSQSYMHRKAIETLLSYFPNNREYILKYYELYDDDKAFIIFNNIEGKDFNVYLKESDKKYLKPNERVFPHLDNGSYCENVVRCIFDTADKKDAVLYQGGLKYLKRVSIDKASLIKYSEN